MGEQIERYVVIHETLTQSILRDLVSFVTTVGIIGVGVLLDSPAMQWFGFVIAMLVILGRSARAKAACFRGTREQAIEHLSREAARGEKADV